jgi:ABC-type nitrate/sulfonate/bicarbonate transport system permease component
LALAAAIAVPLGVALGTNPLLYRSLRIPIEFLRPIPAVALVPIVVLMTGAGFESKLFLATFAATWPLLIQTVYGMQDADPIGRETARAFQVGRMDRLARVTLPGAMPYVATGLRLASSVALTLTVTAEIVIGAGGLGRSIAVASEGGDAQRMYALIAVTGIVGGTQNAALARFERRVLHWHATVRRTGVTA